MGPFFVTVSVDCSPDRFISTVACDGSICDARISTVSCNDFTSRFHCDGFRRFQVWVSSNGIARRFHARRFHTYVFVGPVHPTVSSSWYYSTIPSDSFISRFHAMGCISRFHLTVSSDGFDEAVSCEFFVDGCIRRFHVPISSLTVHLMDLVDDFAWDATVSKWCFYLPLSCDRFISYFSDDPVWRIWFVTLLLDVFFFLGVFLDGFVWKLSWSVPFLMTYRAWLIWHSCLSLSLSNSPTNCLISDGLMKRFSLFDTGLTASYCLFVSSDDCMWRFHFQAVGGVPGLGLAANNGLAFSWPVEAGKERTWEVSTFG